MKLKDLIPNPRNPRQITDEKLEMLGHSLTEFGDLSGIVWNRRSGNLVGGHQRVKKLPEDAEVIITHGYEEPTRTGTIAEGYIVVSGEKWRYREVDWGKNTELAAMIAANKHGGDWDYPVYADVLLELEHANYDLDLTGNSQVDLDKIMAYLPSSEDPLHAIPEHAELFPEVCRIVLFFSRDRYKEVVKLAEMALSETSSENMSDLFAKLLESRKIS